MNLSNINPVRLEIPKVIPSPNGFRHIPIVLSKYEDRPNLLKVRQLMNKHYLTQRDAALLMKMTVISFKNKLIHTRKSDFPLSKLKLLEVELDKKGATA